MADVSKERTGEKRKIQVTGSSTYILSLPKRWAERNQLKEGETVFVREDDDGSLVIGQKVKKQEEEAFVSVLENEEAEEVWRKTTSAYLGGYSRIQIASSGPNKLLSPSLRKNLKGYVRKFFVGTEIVTDKPSELSLQVLLDYRELSADCVLRRMAIIAVCMQKDAISVVGNLGRQKAKSVIKANEEVHRFALWINRQLELAVSDRQRTKAIGLKNERDCMGYRLIVKSVERTADHAVKIAKDALSFKRKLESPIISKIENLSKLTISMFEDSINSLFESNYKKAEKVINSLEETTKLGSEIVVLSRAKGLAESANPVLLVESVKRTAEYASDIAEIVLNLNIESVLGKAMMEKDGLPLSPAHLTDLNTNILSGNLKKELVAMKKVVDEVKKGHLSPKNVDFLERLENAFRLAKSVFGIDTMNFEITKELHERSMKLLVEAKENKFDNEDFEEFLQLIARMNEINDKVRKMKLQPIILEKTKEKIGRARVFRLK
jgi:phosphate uptake regulator